VHCKALALIHPLEHVENFVIQIRAGMRAGLDKVKHILAQASGASLCRQRLKKAGETVDLFLGLRIWQNGVDLLLGLLIWQKGPVESRVRRTLLRPSACCFSREVWRGAGAFLTRKACTMLANCSLVVSDRIATKS